MKKKWIMLVAIIATLTILFITSCKDETVVPGLTPFEILTGYMDTNGMTLTDLLAGWIIAPDSLVQVLDDHYIMDIRTSDKDDNGTVDYYDGHVPGAVFSSFANIVSDAALANHTIVVVCYTGQTAGHAVMALRLSGYTDAKVLKWGMSGWNSEFDLWTGNCAQLDHANWVAAPGQTQDANTYDYPSLNVDGTIGEEILEQRVNQLINDGLKGVADINDDSNGVLDDPGLYFINNYWAADDVTTYGNIVGAYRINPLVLSNLDPDATIVTYCWTGQTSSMITAYLTVLGYNPKSLKFGANSMIYDDLTGHKWSASMEYDYDTSSP